MRRLLLPLLIAGLAIAFIAVCLAVRLRRGNPRWIRRKLVLGGLLLSLTAVVTTGGCDTVVDCYAPIPQSSSNSTSSASSSSKAAQPQNDSASSK